ncbi:MAG: polysaccharide deacetylase family protein, partial [Epsilonproteobacteria bacterium]|nr:polysaccharide deacetylase family protein [Campylobacterota bacterium]
MKKFLVFLAIFIFIIDCILITIKLNQNESKRAIHKAKPHYKYSVFLTSDDGPLKGSRYLDRLIREYQVPFTLFLVGKPFSEDSNLRYTLSRYKSN